MSDTYDRSSSNKYTTQPSEQDHGKTRVLPETTWANDPALTGIPPQGSVVITIAQQFGSGGIEIAHKVAQEDNMQYLDQDIVAEAARQMGLDMQHAVQHTPHTNSRVEHIIDIIQTSNPLNVHCMLSPGALQYQSKEQAYLHLTQRIILEMATQGNAVIVGRGSQFLLRHAPRTLHVSIFAPLPDRITCVMDQFHLNHTIARQLIEQRDYEQDSYLRKYYGGDGRQQALYHLLINASFLSHQHATNIIRQTLPLLKENA